MIETGNGMTLVTGYDMLAIEPVMPGHSRPKDGVASARLCPGNHVFLSFQRQDVDGRNKSGHDERER
jgi:hypothetical protein